MSEVLKKNMKIGSVLQNSFTFLRCFCFHCARGAKTHCNKMFYLIEKYKT